MKKKARIKNPVVRKILSALVVVVFGFILLNLTFLFDAAYQGAVRYVIGLFIPLTPDTSLRWLPALFHGSFVVVIGVISWFVFRSKLRVLYKAIYMTVPLAVVFVTIGIFFYEFPMVPYILGTLFCIGILYYLYRTKKHWLYYFTLILISLVMLAVVLSGMEI